MAAFSRNAFAPESFSVNASTDPTLSGPFAQFVADDTDANQRKWGRVYVDDGSALQERFGLACEVAAGTPAIGKRWAGKTV